MGREGETGFTALAARCSANSLPLLPSPSLATSSSWLESDRAASPPGPSLSCRLALLSPRLHVVAARTAPPSQPVPHTRL